MKETLGDKIINFLASIRIEGDPAYDEAAHRAHYYQRIMAIEAERHGNVALRRVSSALRSEAKEVGLEAGLEVLENREPPLAQVEIGSGRLMMEIEGRENGAVVTADAQLRLPNLASQVVTEAIGIEPQKVEVFEGGGPQTKTILRWRRTFSSEELDRLGR